MSYVTGCHLVVKLETNEIYHRREQPPWLTSMATRTVKNRSLRGGLWHRLREEAGEGGDEGGGGQVAFLRSMKLRRLRLVPGARVICIGMHRAARWPKLTTWNDLQGVLMNVRSCHGPRAVWKWEREKEREREIARG